MQIDLKKTVAVISPMASIILAFLWLDARHDAAGSAESALIESKQYTLAISIADLTSTISRYDGMEAAGGLSQENRSRRDTLRQLKQMYIDQSLTLESQKY